MRRWLLLLVAVVVAALPFAAGARAATPPPTTEPPPSLARPLDECISALPPPGCGHKPEQPGDRGGWMQYLLFVLMFVGLAFIAWRIVHGVRKRPG